MNNILTYKGYVAKIEFDSEDLILFGKVEGIKDLITFESDSSKNIEQEFKNAVDDYLDYCKEIDKEPDVPFKGSFNVRIAPELHKAATIKAVEMNKSLNALVALSLEYYLDEKFKPSVVINYHTTKVVPETVNFNSRTSDFIKNYSRNLLSFSGGAKNAKFN